MMGQAAGTAAAMVVKDGGNCFEKVSVEGLRAQLWEDGVLNPEELPFEQKKGLEKNIPLLDMLCSGVIITAKHIFFCMASCFAFYKGMFPSFKHISIIA